MKKKKVVVGLAIGLMLAGSMPVNVFADSKGAGKVDSQNESIEQLEKTTIDSNADEIDAATDSTSSNSVAVEEVQSSVNKIAESHQPLSRTEDNQGTSNTENSEESSENTKSSIEADAESTIADLESAIPGTEKAQKKYVRVKDKSVEFLYFHNSGADFTTSATRLSSLGRKAYRSTQLVKTTLGRQMTLLLKDDGSELGWVPNSELIYQTGDYIETTGFVTITKKWSLHPDVFFSNPKVPGDSYLNKTLRIKQIFKNTSIGVDYYALYDQNHRFVGYINANGAKFAKHEGGIGFGQNNYATITQKGRAVGQNLNFTKKKGTTDIFYGKTYKVKAKYIHLNGKVIYSLYKPGKKGDISIGYFESDCLKINKGRQGAYLPLNKYMTVTSGSYKVYSDFNWRQKTLSKNILGRTYLVKGFYRYYNGGTYYSLTDNKGNWAGYLSSAGGRLANNAAGICQSETKQVKFSKNNYTIWQNFNWQKRSTSNAQPNKIYTVKGKYRHFNGPTYYTIYDGKKWIGYINALGVISPHTIHSTKNINRWVKVKSGSGNFYASADPNSKKLAAKKTYKGYMARATKEARTSGGTYYYLVLPGGNLGWIKAGETSGVSRYWMETTGGRYPSLKVKNLNIQVSVGKQRVYIKSGSKVIYTMICSTGLPGYPTPYGNFRIQSEKGLSFWYGGSGGAYYRSYKGHGVYLFHTIPIAYPGTTTAYNAREGARLGQKASHGCIRLSVPDAKWFYYNMPYNTPVKIVH